MKGYNNIKKRRKIVQTFIYIYIAQGYEQYPPKYPPFLPISICMCMAQSHHSIKIDHIYISSCMFLSRIKYTKWFKIYKIIMIIA